MTRAEMYQTVRESIPACRCDDCCKARTALAALEAEEQEAPKVGPATPPAPPAAECAARNALRKFAEFYQQMEIGPDYSYMCERISDWFGASDFKAASAARAAPCECQRLREERELLLADCAGLRGQRGTLMMHAESLSAELAAAKSEIARLTAERDEALLHLHCPTIAHLPKVRHSDAAWERKCTAVAAELRQAVDAMREADKYCAAIEQNRIRMDVAMSTGDARRDLIISATQQRAKYSAIVAAYDAKHGEKP